MSTRKITFAEGEYYHIYNRGNDKRTIFHDKKDYQYFLWLLYLANQHQKAPLSRLTRTKGYIPFEEERSTQIVSIGAYVLMPNHFHILITEKQKEGISKFMQKVTTGYVMYYNNRYKRSGGLFEGKFKAQHANSDRYLKYLFSYIHLNPVKLIDATWKEKGIKHLKKTLEFLKGYQYSSFNDYQNEARPQQVILHKKDFPNYFSIKKDFYKEIVSWLRYKNEDQVSL